MSVPNTFNPSDYEYLLKSLIDGTPIAKSQSLKRFNTLVVNDKKQFGVYAKRIILALQDLMFEPKQEINLLTSMLVLQIINLNPKDMQYYVRTKLLKHIVFNLGDSKTQLRKTSHYCLLAYVKVLKNFDEIINMYLDNGINSPEPQLRQKCINSFQSILITEIKYLNWASSQLKKIFEALIQRLKDQNPFVQKAAEQCLLTISRMEQVKGFIKKLSPTYFGLYKIFCQTQRDLGNLVDFKIYTNQKQISSQKSILNATPTESHKSDKTYFSQPIIHLQKNTLTRQESINKQAIIERIEQIRRNAQTPKIQQESNKNLIKKSESLNLPRERKNSIITNRQQKKVEEHKIEKQIVKDLVKQIVKERPTFQPPPKIVQSAALIKTEKVQNIFGKKVLEDLKNDKDWKIRLEAIQQLQTKFQMYKQVFQVESLMKNFVPVLIKLLADQNFKIAFISLKIVEQILKMPFIKFEQIIPQVIEKLNDTKIALRQNVSKLIRSEYLTTNNNLWIDCLLDQLKKNASPSLRQQVLNIFIKLYEETNLAYSFQKIIQFICPLMDDSKTKVKIRTLDLLVLITVKVQKVDNIKSILMNKMNQVYYEMYLEKVGKELKSYRSTPRLSDQDSQSTRKDKQSRSVAFPSLKKNKTSANNTTSSSLQKYSKTTEAKPLNRASSFVQKEKKADSFISQSKLESLQLYSARSINNKQYYQEVSERGQLTPNQSVRKKPLKNYKKKLQKTLQSKLLTNYTTDSENLKPLSDPQKEIKNILVDIKSEDWQISFDSLTKLRRIIQHHSDFLNIVVIKSLIGDIMRHVESLRSSLSKNAVITLNQFSNQVKKNLDSELDSIFTKLMRKTLDANSFISQQVKKALISISTNCNETKVLTLLFNYHTSRAIPIKQNITYILESIIYIPKVYEKELERIVQILVNFMGEGALEIREKTKTLLTFVLSKEKQTSKIYKLIPSDVLQKLKKKQSTLPKPEPINVSLAKQKQNQQSPQQGISPLRKKKKIVIFPQQFNELQEMVLKCENAQWKIRLQSLSKIIKIIQKYPEQITQHKMASKIIDMVSRQTNDPNSKVSSNALALFKQIIPCIPKLIESNLSFVINEQFNCFASQKSQIRETSLELFDIIADNIEKWMLIQHLCNGALYGPIRSRASILVKLLKILPDCFKQKRSIISKNVYTTINKLAQDNKNQILPILRQLVGICLNLGGDDALSALKQQAKSLLAQ